MIDNKGPALSTFEFRSMPSTILNGIQTNSEFSHETQDLISRNESNQFYSEKAWQRFSQLFGIPKTKFITIIDNHYLNGVEKQSRLLQEVGLPIQNSWDSLDPTSYSYSQKEFCPGFTASPYTNVLLWRIMEQQKVIPNGQEYTQLQTSLSSEFITTGVHKVPREYAKDLLETSLDGGMTMLDLSLALLISYSSHYSIIHNRIAEQILKISDGSVNTTWNLHFKNYHLGLIEESQLVDLDLMTVLPYIAAGFNSFTRKMVYGESDLSYLEEIILINLMDLCVDLDRAKAELDNRPYNRWNSPFNEADISDKGYFNLLKAIYRRYFKDFKEMTDSELSKYSKGT